MTYKYHDQQEVDFEIRGSITGTGIVVGVAGIAQPIIGCSYIVEVFTSSVTLPNDEYPFSTIVVPEFCLSESKS